MLEVVLPTAEAGAAALTVVAFGDSLTYGLVALTPSRPSPVATPYTQILEEKSEELGRELGLEIEVHNRGLCGEETAGMAYGLRREVLSLKPDFAIVLGGANDLERGLWPDHIAANLIAIYEQALEAGVEPIACTVPPVLGSHALIPPREELNQIIQNYCARRGIACVDLFAALGDPMTRFLLRVYSSDGLHLSAAGYQRMGEVIWETLEDRIRRKYGPAL